jgi:hypothetical protein
MATYGTNSIPATYSTTFDTLDQMMSSLPDNTQNLINAKDARDSVFTLWNRIDVLTATVSLIDDVPYTNLNPSTVTVGGIVAGSTFSNYTLQNLFDLMLYPYTPPTGSLSGGNNREYGSSGAINLSYSVDRGSNLITSIQIVTPSSTQSVVPTGNDQTGNLSTNTSANMTYSFVMTVSDGVDSTVSSTTVTWSNKIYWGTLPIGNPLVTVGTSTFSYSTINLGTVNGELNSPEVHTQTRIISASNSYVFFMWPTRINTGFNINTSMLVGGFANNNFTQTRSGIQYTNPYGYIEPYDVWVYNNVLYSTNTFTITS